MKTGCFLSPFIDTVDAKVCIFNLQSISQAGLREFEPVFTAASASRPAQQLAEQDVPFIASQLLRLSTICLLHSGIFCFATPKNCVRTFGNTRCERKAPTHSFFKPTSCCNAKTTVVDYPVLCAFLSSVHEYPPQRGLDE